MTSIRLATVFAVTLAAVTLAMVSFSALLSLGGLRRADPADMF